LSQNRTVSGKLTRASHALKKLAHAQPSPIKTQNSFVSETLEQRFKSQAQKAPFRSIEGLLLEQGTIWKSFVGVKLELNLNLIRVLDSSKSRLALSRKNIKGAKSLHSLHQNKDPTQSQLTVLDSN
jgi:hypothetical protein